MARKLGVTRADLAEANYLGTSTRLNAGQSLIVPRAPSLLQAKESRSVDVIVQDGRERRMSGRSPTAAARSRRLNVRRRKQRLLEPQRIRSSGPPVKAGETLTSIARTYGRRSLRSRNGTSCEATPSRPGSASRSWSSGPSPPTDRGPSVRQLPSDSGDVLSVLTHRGPRPELRDVLLDTFGQLTLVLQRAQSVLRFLHDELEPRQLDRHVLDDGLLLAERFEIDAEILEQVCDQVGLNLYRVDGFAPPLDRCDFVFSVDRRWPAACRAAREWQPRPGDGWSHTRGRLGSSRSRR